MLSRYCLQYFGAVGRHFMREDMSKHPFFTDQVLLEIPFYLAVGKMVVPFFGKPCIQRGFITAFNMHFGRHRKSNAIFCSAEGRYLIIRQWFLKHKIVRWKAYHNKPVLMRAV